ncbi:MAG: N-acetyltransferase family protein, partial [Planctomycetota bacterium]
MNRAGRPTPSSASTGAPAGEVTIRPVRDSFFGSEVDAAVALYNRAHEGLHGFFPLTPRRFRRRVLESPHFQPDLFLLAEAGGRPVGLVHAAALGAPCHEDGGVVELLAVDPDHRGQGIGGLLLDAALGRLARRRPPVIDGGGAFPFSPFYATLLDGSERSGIPAESAAALRLFLRRGF